MGNSGKSWEFFRIKFQKFQNIPKKFKKIFKKFPRLYQGQKMQKYRKILE